MRRDSPGFTIIEALAAVVILGLLAAAVVPLLRSLGRQTGSERLLAQGYLRALSPPDGLVAGMTMPIGGHPGWRLTVSDLHAEAEPAPPSGQRPPAAPPHHWLLLTIEDDGRRERLAETVIAVFDQP